MAVDKKRATLTLVVTFEDLPDTDDLKSDLVEAAKGYGHVVEATLEIHGPATFDLRN